MEEIVSYLKKSIVQYFATIGLDGNPKVRPFKFMFEDDGKLWFCTSNEKEIYKELQKNPHIELCVSGEILSWLRLNGMVVFSNNIQMKEKILEINPLVKSIYKEPNNPNFEVFYLNNVTASINEIGKSPVIYSLP